MPTAIARRASMRTYISRFAATAGTAKRKRMHVIGELTARVSHELRNVLMVGKSMTSVLQRCMGTSEKAANALRHIDTALFRGEQLLSELLSYAAPRPATVEPLRFRSWLGEFRDFASYAVKCGVRVEADDVDDDLIVHADPHQLSQLLTNLVLNANDAITDTGRIRIRAERRAEGVVLEVADNGPGMSKEVASRVFDSRFTTKAKGTGLGLAIAKRIATAHGGWIRVETAPNAGSSFQTFFPAGR